jgi:Mg-chelatase subunit ChlI
MEISQHKRVAFVDQKLSGSSFVNHVRIDGREWFKVMYDHVINHVKDRLPMNVMGNKGIGKTHRLAALAALLLKEVCSP